MIDPLISKTIAVGFSLLWLGAAWHKLGMRQSFAGVLDDYGLFPAFALRPLTFLVPLIELALGISWLLGFAPVMVAMATGTLLLTYATAIAINLLRGRAYISCGCGLSPGPDDQPLSWTLVVRNLVLLLCAVLTLLPQAQRLLGLADYAVLVVALLVTALLQAAVSQLLRNRAAMGAWSQAND